MDNNEKKFYEVEEIQSILKIGRTNAYAFIREVYIKQEPFRVIKIGRLYRIHKTSFDQWIN